MSNYSCFSKSPDSPTGSPKRPKEMKFSLERIKGAIFGSFPLLTKKYKNSAAHLFITDILVNIDDVCCSRILTEYRACQLTCHLKISPHTNLILTN